MIKANQNFFVLFYLLFPIFLQKEFLKNFTFEKIPNFSEKLPSEGLELVILLHTQY